MSLSDHFYADEDIPIDCCVHEPQIPTIDIVQKRLSLPGDLRGGRRPSEKRRVSFRDEELGLTPRHVVTQTHYRPRTADEEKSELYYNSHDFDIFEHEDLYDQIDEEIREIERRKEEQRASGALGPVVVDETKLKNLIRRVERQVIAREFGVEEM